MDYLIFLTGLFLLTTAVGSWFCFRGDRCLSRWPMFSLAMVALGLKIWCGVAAFALGLTPEVAPIKALLDSVFASALLCYCLAPFSSTKWSPFVFKALAVVAMFGLIFLRGGVPSNAAVYAVLVVVIALIGGWRAEGIVKELFRAGGASHPLLNSVLLGFVAAIGSMPGIEDVAFGTSRLGSEPLIILTIVLIIGATACSALFALNFWGHVIRANRGPISEALVRRRKVGVMMVFGAMVFVSINGAWLAHWLGNLERQSRTSTLLSALHLCAHNMPSAQIEGMVGEPEEVTTANYRTLRYQLLRIREALQGVRFVYILGMRGNRLVFLVDAENPGNQETFSSPGEPVEDFPQNWQAELAGQATLKGPDHDKWGVWFSASVPIYNDDDGLVGLLGLDWPADVWLKPIVSRRVAAMGVTLSVVLLLIALLGFHLISIESARVVESLSGKLSDAMFAAGVDTWECRWRPFRIEAGARIAESLGWTGVDAKPSLRKVWSRIHPDDRQLLRSLTRHDESPEIDVRILNADGQWHWFALRARIVHSPNGRVSGMRLVGTILNIDERQRSRIEIDKERRFGQRVMEAVPGGLAVMDAEGVITYANPAFVDLTGGEAALANQPIESWIADAVDYGREGVETKLHRVDGSSLVVQAFRAPLIEDQETVGSILALVDLTRIKSTEQELLQSRADADRLALVAKRTDNAVVITDSQGCIEWVNEGFTRISGYSKEELIGQKPGHILQGNKSNPELNAYMREHIVAGKGFEAEILNYTKAGRAYMVHIECQPLVNKQGDVTGFMAIERDITQARRSSMLLEAVATTSTKLLSKQLNPCVWTEILEALGTAANVDRSYIFHIHPHPVTGVPAMSQFAEWTSGSVTPLLANQEYQNLPFEASGYGRWYRKLLAGEEICGTVDSMPEEERPMIIAQEIRSLVVVPIFTGDLLTGFMGFDACVEDRIWEDWEISILRSAAANIGLRQVVQQESDALVLARDEARHAALAADRANRSKSTFLATMSHEIRTPLNAVIGMASLLETTALNPQQLDFATTIINSSNFLLDLINDVLDYSRIESGRIDLESVPIHLFGICREAFDVIRPGTIGKDIELVCRIGKGIPDKLLGDRSRIRQMLVNLLGNAAKFTHQGFISLVVEGAPAADGRWKITFEIKDSGIGISEDALTRLFQPFVQEDARTTRRFGGSGLGLAICKRLAELMDGDIEVTSVKEQGSVFLATIYLNISDTEESSPNLPRPMIPKDAIKILVVDDNELNQRILEETLASWGQSAHVASSGPEAIRMWNELGPYDLVFTDYHMPDMDGVDLVRHLRALPGASRTRFSLVSSEGSYSAEIRRLFDDVSSKPIWPSSIHATLTRLFPGIIPGLGPTRDASVYVEASELEMLKVLVAEDNVNNQKVIRLLLRRLGIEADLVENGEQAVAAVVAGQYDIVLLDVQMPVMDGLEASRRIRSLVGLTQPAIVALTANAFKEDRDAANAAGMDYYLPKPITLARLREMLHTILKSPPPKP